MNTRAGQGKDICTAFFCMEIAINEDIPTYAGGLGVLSGDILRSLADLNIPAVAVTLASNKGYFTQKLDEEGNQIELPVEWNIDDFMTLMPEKITVPIEGREVEVQAWRYLLTGIEGHQIPVYFLDTNTFGNNSSDREITWYLYGGDHIYRLKQEVVLGIGGVRMLKAFGYNVKKYHMNEGHSAFVVIELMKHLKESNPEYSEGDVFELVREKCVFTTHTPVPAGHDRFPTSAVANILRGYLKDDEVKKLCYTGELNMTLLALDHSKYINGVAKRHEEVSRNMFPGYPIDSITNGVHHVFWTSKPFRELFDSHVKGWRKDPFDLRYVISIPENEILKAHEEAKKELINYVNSRYNVKLDYDVFTIGFARRMTKYKRPDLLFNDTESLLNISSKIPFLVVIAGKAHPDDFCGKEIIKFIFRMMKELKGRIKIVFLENYDLSLAKLIVSGVDLWLNTPKKPLEASGTSGMKACLNGVPSLSVLDGWWVEGCIEGITGWSIGSGEKLDSDDEEDADDLYHKLENVIMPVFYENRNQWAEIMRYTIAFNSSFFNSHRMVQEYTMNAYFP